MVLTPVCLVQNGINPYVGTTTGVDVTPGATISIKLATPVGPTAWFLEILGADELTTPLPTLTGVNGSPSTIVTFTFPAASGRAIGFRSTVTGTGGPISTSFGIYSLTTFATRVGFVTETREGDPTYGWASKLNPLIRSGGGGGGGPDNFSWKVIPDSDTVIIPEYQEMWISAPLTVEGTLELVGDVLLLDESNLGGGVQGDPGPVGPAIVDAPYNKHMPALATGLSDFQLACSTGLAVTPHVNGNISVSVNGIAVTDIGYGTRTGVSCYWSADGGVTSKLRPDITLGDRLYWNITWAEYDLTVLDFIDFWYDIAL